MKYIDLSCLLSQNLFTLRSNFSRGKGYYRWVALYKCEGYTRANNILISKYGKSSKLANSQNIMSLPHINSVNLKKIHEFTEKLLGSVLALEAMDKLKEICQVNFRKIVRDKSRSGKNG